VWGGFTEEHGHRRAGILPKGDLRFAPVARPGDARRALVRSVEFVAPGRQTLEHDDISPLGAREFCPPRRLQQRVIPHQAALHKNQLNSVTARLPVPSEEPQIITQGATVRINR
jgi:hypothetical protein